MVSELHHRLPDIFRDVETAKQLEKVAAAYNDTDVTVATEGAIDKLAEEVFAFAKEASWKDTLGTKALQGLGLGAGVALPAVAGGAYLLHRGKEEAKETAENVRNQVLLSALGLGGIGAGLYGLHRATGGGAVDVNAAIQQLVGNDTKQASDTTTEPIAELVIKLATVGAIEAMLEDDSLKLSEDGQKLASDLRKINRRYGMQLLHEASHL